MAERKDGSQITDVLLDQAKSVFQVRAAGENRNPGEYVKVKLTDVDQMSLAEVRALITAVEQETIRLRGELSLLINGVVYQERSRGLTELPISVLAKAVGITEAETYRVLAGDFEADAATWRKISRLLGMCRASRAPENVSMAYDLFKQLMACARKRNALSERRMELLRPRHRTAGRAQDTSPYDAFLRTSADSRTTTCPRCDTKITAFGSAAGRTDAGDTCPLCRETMRRSDQAPTTPPEGRQISVPEPVADAPGRDCKPDPGRAATQAEFMDLLRAYRIWAGNPSLRDLEANAHKKISYSTFRNVFISSTLPQRLDVVETVVLALGGTEEDRKNWASAWRVLMNGSRASSA